MKHVHKQKFVNCLALMAVLLVYFPSERSEESERTAHDWPQWAQNPQHTLALSRTKGQPPRRILENIINDFNVEAEQANPNAGGSLNVHYQVPLTDGDDVFVASKDGVYSNTTYSTQKWHQNKYRWDDDHLVKVWTFDTDWIAPGSARDFWEPVYHAALANGFLYDPGLGGTVFKIDKATGAVISRINPFDPVLDPNTFAISPLTADGDGNIFYNVVKIAAGSPVSFFKSNVLDSWLVKIGPHDEIAKVRYSDLLAQAEIKGEPVPAADGLCELFFFPSQLPWPPQPDAQPRSRACGSQRPPMNLAPAIAPDGTIYTVTRAHFALRNNYLIAVNGDLTGRWAASLRGRLNDGCGVSIPIGNPGGAGANGGCREGAHFGVDPETNQLPAGIVLDDASSTPTIAPDGSIFFGVYTRYNYAQGHLMHFTGTGEFLGAFGFGWDSTPAIYLHDDTYSVVIKDNHYGIGTYCSDPNWCPTERTSAGTLGPEAYFITQLDPSLNVEWRFQNTNTQSCARNPDGTVTCQTVGGNGFEWCVNAPAVDAHGTVYANSEDGNLYEIRQGGRHATSIFLQQATGAAYTPLSIGGDGKIYSQNDGHLFVVGK